MWRHPQVFNSGLKQRDILTLMMNFLMKQMMKSQIKKLPVDQQAIAHKVVDENPELLMKIAEEVQAEMKQGKDQMAALMIVAERHKDEMQALMGNK